MKFFAFLLAVAGLSLTASSASAQKAPGAGGPKPSVLYFRVTDFGVEPARVEVHPGPAIIVVENNVNITGLQLDLQRSTRETVLQLKNKNRGLKMRQSVTLTPGTFVLQDPVRPKWQAIIVVEEKR